ncbi:hypothetical protein AVEN_125609-2-1, partial [Araneus ventricosus]
LVILTFHFEATRGLFWDRPRRFEPWSDDEDDTSASSPFLQASSPHQQDYVWPPTYYLTCNFFFSGIGFRTWNPLAPRSRHYPFTLHYDAPLTPEISEI